MKVFGIGSGGSPEKFIPKDRESTEKISDLAVEDEAEKLISDSELLALKSLEQIQADLEGLELRGDEGLVMRETLKHSLEDIYDLLQGGDEKGFNRLEIAHQGLVRLEELVDDADDLGLTELKNQVTKAYEEKFGQSVAEITPAMDLDWAKEQLVSGMKQEVPDEELITLAEEYLRKESLDKRFIQEVTAPGSGYKKLAMKIRESLERVGADLDEKLSSGVLSFLADKRVFSRLATATSVGLVLSGCAIQGMPNINTGEESPVAVEGDLDEDLEGINEFKNPNVVKYAPIYIHEAYQELEGVDLDNLTLEQDELIKKNWDELVNFTNDQFLISKISKMIVDGEIEKPVIDNVFDRFAYILPESELNELVVYLNNQGSFAYAEDYFKSTMFLVEKIGLEDENVRNFLINCAKVDVPRDLDFRVIVENDFEFARKLFEEYNLGIIVAEGTLEESCLNARLIGSARELSDATDNPLLQEEYRKMSSELFDRFKDKVDLEDAFDWKKNSPFISGLPEEEMIEFYKGVISNQMDSKEQIDKVVRDVFGSDILFNDELRLHTLKIIEEINPFYLISGGLDDALSGGREDVVNRFKERSKEELEESASRLKDFLSRMNGYLQKATKEGKDLPIKGFFQKLIHSDQQEFFLNLRWVVNERFSGEFSYDNALSDEEKALFRQELWDFCLMTSYTMGEGFVDRDIITPNKLAFKNFLTADWFLTRINNYANENPEEVSNASAFSVATASFAEAKRRGLDLSELDESSQREIVDAIIEKREQVKNYELFGPNNYLMIVGSNEDDFHEDGVFLREMYQKAGGEGILFDNSANPPIDKAQADASEAELKKAIEAVRDLEDVRSGKKTVTIIFINHGPEIILTPKGESGETIFTHSELSQALNDSGVPEGFNLINTACYGADFYTDRARYSEQIEGVKVSPRIEISSSNEGNLAAAFRKSRRGLRSKDLISLRDVLESRSIQGVVTVEDYYKMEGGVFAQQDLLIRTGEVSEEADGASAFSSEELKKRREDYEKGQLEVDPGKPVKSVMEIGAIGKGYQEVEIV